MAETAPAGGIAVGTMLAETYRVTGLLGRGGMGAVWAADHARLPGKRVAVKVLHAEVASDDESLARFRREAEIASRLGHPNIVDVLDFNVLPDGTPYLVLEFLEGEDLSQRLQRGPLPLDETASIIRQIGSALQAAHREQIIHRDLKPQNIFLVPTESGGYVSLLAKVLDFGISKIRGSQTVKTNAATMLGTPQYMAPEQALGQHDQVDARTDVFALGAMVYEMLAGRPAFLGQTIPEVVFKVVYEDPTALGNLAEVPPGVSDAVMRAMSKKQEERFPDVSSFVAALTGSPLDTLQRGGVIARGDGASGGAPTGALSGSQPAKVRTGEALAGTAAAQVNGALAATVDSGQAPALAATVDSGKAALAATVDSGLGPAVATADSARKAEEQQPRSRKGLWLGLGFLAVAGAAVAITVVATRGNGNSSPTAAATPPTAPPVAPALPGGEIAPGKTAADIAGAAKQVDEATKQASAQINQAADQAGKMVETALKNPAELQKTIDQASKNADRAAKAADHAAKVTDRATHSRATHRATASDDDDAPTTIKKKLIDAEAQLRAGNAEQARAIAQRTLQVRRTQAAHAVIAKAYCQMHYLGMANANLVRVKKRALRRQVLRYCKKQGTDLTP